VNRAIPTAPVEFVGCPLRLPESTILVVFLAGALLALVLLPATTGGEWCAPPPNPAAYGAC
jgi:hypothetical protein